MPYSRVKARLLIFLLGILSLPALQQMLQLIKSGALYGEVTYASDTVFSWRSWFSGAYQDKKTAYINDHIGFQPDLVRLGNQVDWYLFDKLHVRNTLIGTDGHLYEKSYVEVYLGVNYHSEPAMKERLVKLKGIQDALKGMGKKLLLVYAPSQARYYPDNFPVDMTGGEGIPNLYRTHIRISDSLHIEYLDFNGWFESLRKHSEHLLFSKIGVHWTDYGALLASDSVSKYLERVDGIDMPDLVVDNVIVSDDPGAISRISVIA